MENPLQMTIATPLRSQDARLSIGPQLNPIGSSKHPFLLSGGMPVAGEKPLAFFPGMALTCPAHEPLLQQIIISAHGCCRDNAVVVGCPSHNQWIELRNDARLWSSLQLLQTLLNSSQVTLARFFAGGDDGLDPQRVFLRSRPAHERSDDGLAPRRMFLSTLTPGDVLYWLLANTVG